VIARGAAPAAARVAQLRAVALAVLLIAAMTAAQAPALAHPHSKRARAGSHRRRAAHAGQTPSGGLSLTPYMGWDTYFAFGGAYSEATVLRQASELVTLGLRGEGFRYVWLDVGWWQGARDGAGQIAVNPRQWPHGMAWLTHALHSVGLLAGIYTDAGRNGCGGAGQGSGGRYRQDVDTFAGWGFDAVKLDFCGGAEEQLDPAAAYASFHAAIASSAPRRAMLLSICNFLQPGQYAQGRPTLGESAFASYTFGPSVGNSWRTDTDVGFPGKVSFADVLRNMDADAATPEAAGPGHWNDPDYLGPDQGLSAAQFRTQLSMWSMLAAPLMISDDLTRASPSTRAALTNAEVIAIDQDPAGVQGRLVSSAGSGQVWAKPLSGGARAVALLNRSGSSTRITTSAAAIGMPAGGGYVLRDVWAHSTRISAEEISAVVGADSTVLLRVSQTA
jgi:alpha-galactosidase